MVAIRNKLVCIAAMLSFAPLLSAQGVSPSARPPVATTPSGGAAPLAARKTPPLTDASAHAEIKKLRGSVDTITRTLKAMQAKAAANKTAPPARTSPGVSTGQAADSSLPWIMLIAAALISGAIAYLVSRLAHSNPAPVHSAPEASSNGVVDAQAFRRRMAQEERTERIATLSQIRAKLDELEGDARNYAGVYMLMLAYRTARNAPLQRLAEISTREQEALLRYRSAAGHVVSLGYEYGRMPAAQIEAGLPEDLGAWLTHWWTELEGTLETDPETDAASQKRNELFQQVRQKLQALVSAERESASPDKERPSVAAPK